MKLPKRLLVLSNRSPRKLYASVSSLEKVPSPSKPSPQTPTHCLAAPYLALPCLALPGKYLYLAGCSSPQTLRVHTAYSVTGGPPFFYTSTRAGTCQFTAWSCLLHADHEIINLIYYLGLLPRIAPATLPFFFFSLSLFLLHFNLNLPTYPSA